MTLPYGPWKEIKGIFFDHTKEGRELEATYAAAIHVQYSQMADLDYSLLLIPSILHQSLIIYAIEGKSFKFGFISKSMLVCNNVNYAELTKSQYQQTAFVCL